jgi:hypothetical protein
MSALFALSSLQAVATAMGERQAGLDGMLAEGLCKRFHHRQVEMIG